MKFPKIKRNKKIEMIIAAFIIFVVGVMAIIILFDKPEDKEIVQPSEQPSLDASTEPEPVSVETEDPEDSTTIGKDEIDIDFEKVSFPLVSDKIKNIEITSETDGVCNEETKWKLNFVIKNTTATKDNKYAFKVTPTDGRVYVNYKTGVPNSVIKETPNFYFNEERGSMTPILYHGITWEPPEERNTDTIKLYVHTININSKCVESVFYILIAKDGDSYRITEIKTAEISGEEKEKIYNIATEYKNNNGSLGINLNLMGCSDSVVATIPVVDNEVYYISNKPRSGVDIGPVIAAYIKYDTINFPIEIKQGNYILYLNPETLEVIGEGEMTIPSPEVE